MGKLEIGKMALFGRYKVKRIYLGSFNGTHLAVRDEDRFVFKEGLNFDTTCWNSVEAIEDEPVYETRWLWVEHKKRYSRNIMYVTDEVAEKDGYIVDDSYQKTDQSIKVKVIWV